MSLLRLCFAVAPAACAALACTATTTGGEVGPPAEDVAAAPQCAPGTFQLGGVVDSADRTSTAPVGNYGFANVGNPSTLSVEFGLGGRLDLSWSGTIADGTRAMATGTVTLPASGGSAPEIFCVGAGSEIEPFAWGGKFLLAGLRHAPTADACAAPASLSPATGDVLGCYGWKSQ